MTIKADQARAAPKDDGNADTKKPKDAPEEEPEELSEEDQRLKDMLESLVVQLTNRDESSIQRATEQIGNEIKTATSSMTSVPKPLKFLRPHYAAVKAAHASAPSACQPALADLASVLASVAADESGRECLELRLAGTGCDPAVWGHEYMRHLAGEIASEYDERVAASPPRDISDVMKLVRAIVPHHMRQNGEPEAVDLLLEVDAIGELVEYVDADNAGRACLYLTSAAEYLPEPDDAAVLRAALEAYLKVRRWHDAMRVALRLNDLAVVERVFVASGEASSEAGAASVAEERTQLGYLLGRHGTLLDCESGPCTIADEAERQAVVDAMSNTALSERYLALARDLDVLEAKLPEDVYKQHLLEPGRGGGGGGAGGLDSAAKNLSASIVNALLNLGFGTDKLVTVDSAAEAGTAASADAAGDAGGGGAAAWIVRNKDQGRICAVASIGAIHMWDFNAGMPAIDRYTYSEDPLVLAGACLGFGLTCTAVRSELDPAFALLFEHVASTNEWVRAAATMGLGLAYAGARKPDVRDLLLPLLEPDMPPTAAAHAALALAHVYAATADGDIAEAILQWLMTAPEDTLEGPWARLAAVALACLFLGKGDAADATLEVARSLNPRIARFAAAALQSAAYAGTGNVLQVQAMLALCSEHAEEGEDDWQRAHLVPAVLGLALVAMGEPLGRAMATRTLEHVLAYGAPPARTAVPLALALLHASDPDMHVMDTLSRLSHDADTAVARAALLALGVLGAGTNNARLAGILRNLSAYYARDAGGLHLVRVAQGLLHLGKGLCTLAPFHSDRTLLSPLALTSLLTVLFCGADVAPTLCGKHAFMIFYLAPAARPRCLITVDEAGALVPVSVRVGTAVDTVAQAGRPKAITGFQTHDTPVLLAADERAELATEKWVPVTPLLEGVVIVRKNAAFIEGAE